MGSVKYYALGVGVVAAATWWGNVGNPKLDIQAIGVHRYARGAT
jgi:hypothetical protein